MVVLKRSAPSSAAATIGSNDDLLMELLIFFPAKSLIRFQLVNKQWRSVISSTTFRHLHTIHQSRRPKPQTSFLLRIFPSRFFICHPNIKRLVPYRLGLPNDIIVLQSCNGLLLLTRGRKSCYVFNPTTMQFRDLLVTKAFLGISLVFDPSKSPHYKVFCFRNSRLGVRPVSVSVYESETHTWNDRAGSGLELGKFCDGVYWNGNIYFIKSHGVSRRFFLEDEEVYGLTSPPRARGKKHHTIESNGHMHSVMLSDDNWLSVYELSDVDFSWSLKYVSYLNQAWASFAADNEKGTCITLLGMIREEAMLLFYVPGKVLIYRFLTDTFELLVDFSRESYFEEGRSQLGFKDAHQIIESLAPV